MEFLNKDIEQVIVSYNQAYKDLFQKCLARKDELEYILGLPIGFGGYELSLWFTKPSHHLFLISSSVFSREAKLELMSAYSGIRWLVHIVTSVYLLQHESALGDKYSAYFRFLERQCAMRAQLLTSLLSNLFNQYNLSDIQNKLHLFITATPMPSGQYPLFVIREPTVSSQQATEIFDLVNQLCSVTVPFLSLTLTKNQVFDRQVPDFNEIYAYLLSHHEDALFKCQILNLKPISSPTDDLAVLQNQVLRLYTQSEIPYAEMLLRILWSEVQKVTHGGNEAYQNLSLLLTSVLQARTATLCLTLHAQYNQHWQLITPSPSQNSFDMALTELHSFFNTLQELASIYYSVSSPLAQIISRDDEKSGTIASLMGFLSRSPLTLHDNFLYFYYELLDRYHNQFIRLEEQIRKTVHDTGYFKRLITSTAAPLPQSLPRISEWFSDQSACDDLVFPRGKEESIAKQLLQKHADKMSFFGEELEEFILRVSVTTLHNVINSRIFENIATEKNADIIRNQIIHLLRTTTGIEMSSIFRSDPYAFWRFLSSLEPELIEVIAQRNNSGIQDAEQLRHIFLLFQYCSPFIMRFIRQLIKLPPRFLLGIGDLSEMKKLAWNNITSVYHQGSRSERLTAARIFFDLEFARAILMMLTGSTIQEIDNEYAVFSDRFLRILFAIIKEDFEHREPERKLPLNKFVLYLAGGVARKQSFNDDYDMIAFVTDSCTEEERAGFSHIVALFSHEISKTGIMTHHRFAEFTNSYVISQKDLTLLLANGYEADFIEKTQLLGTRMLIGTRHVDQYFCQQVITPHIYRNWKKFASDIKNEILNRHDERVNTDSEYHIKECPGGLRDIELLLLGFQAKLGIREPIAQGFSVVFGKHLSQYTPQFNQLEATLIYLKRLQSFLRLIIGSDELLENDWYRPIASFMGYKGGNALSDMLSDFRAKTTASRQIMTYLLRVLVE